MVEIRQKLHILARIPTAAEEEAEVEAEAEAGEADEGEGEEQGVDKIEGNRWKIPTRFVWDFFLVSNVTFAKFFMNIACIRCVTKRR